MHRLKTAKRGHNEGPVCLSSSNPTITCSFLSSPTQTIRCTDFTDDSSDAGERVWVVLQTMPCLVIVHCHPSFLFATMQAGKWCEACMCRLWSLAMISRDIWPISWEQIPTFSHWFYGKEAQHTQQKLLREHSGRLTHQRGTLPRPNVCGRWSDLNCSDQTWSGSEHVQFVRARAAKIGYRKQSDSYTHVYACAPLCLSVATQKGRRSIDVSVLPAVLIAAPTIVDKASSSVFRKQNATQVAPKRSPWARFASRKLLFSYHILTCFWAVLLTTRVTWVCQLLVACFGALLAKLHNQYLWDQAESTVIHSGTLCIQRKVTKFPCFWWLVFRGQFQHFLAAFWRSFLLCS